MSQSIKDIREELKKEEVVEELQAFIEKYQEDERKGVKKLIEQAKSKIKAEEEEEERLEKLLLIEKELDHLTYICGIDEAGRGPLAGPVVAGAVILKKHHKIKFLNDSKKLKEERREMLYEQIMEEAVAVGVGIVHEREIDDINILQATYKAMRIAIENLKVKPEYLLNDAVIIPEVKIPQMKIIKGDEKSMSIAAASVIAKVTRDRIMRSYDEVYPEYEFVSNKGYGSKTHIERLKKYGPCDIHRRSFIHSFV